MDTVKKNPILKPIFISAIWLIALWLIYTLLFNSGYNFGYGMNYQYGNHHGGGYFYMGTGLGFLSTISFVLLLLIKIFFVVFVVSLIAGIALYIKNYLFTGEDVQKLRGTFACKPAAAKATCGICAKELGADWKVCPYCGKEVKTQTEKETQNA